MVSVLERYFIQITNFLKQLVPRIPMETKLSGMEVSSDRLFVAVLQLATLTEQLQVSG